MRDRTASLHNLGFALALLLLLALGVLAHRTQHALLQANASVARSLQLISAAQGTLSALQDVETGMRGYVITADPAFLRPYRTGQQRVAYQRAELARLVGHAPGREAWMRELEQAISLRLQLARSNVDAVRMQGRAAAAERVRSAGGRQAMDHVRLLLDGLENDVREGLAAERRALGAQVKRARWLNIAGSGSALLLLLAAMVAVNRNLRERARLLDDAREAAARQAAIVEAVPDTLWQVDVDGETHPLTAQQPPVSNAIATMLRARARSPHAGVHAFEVADGDSEYEARIVTTHDGHLAIVRDITEASRTRRALDSQRRFLRTIVDTDENLIFVRDADGRFVLCNVAFCDLLMLDPSQVEGRSPQHVARCATVAPLLQGDESLVLDDDEWRGDRVQVTDAHGAARWLQVLKRPFDPGDGGRQVLTVAVDITARMRAEQLKNEFISTISHELRTPLTSIRGSLSMLASGLAGDVPAPALPLLDIANKNTERLVRLINDILDIEKLESGRMQLQPQPSDVRALVAHAVEQIGPYAREFDVSLELRPGAHGHALVDPDRFAQVMANLLSNAIKHSPRDGRVLVEVLRRDEGIEVAVQDHGAGIPEAFQPHVFERFAQADASDARLRGGTGLGLAITRSLVEQMGGGIGFQTAAGEGTRFRVWLPEVPGTPESAGDAVVAMNVSGGARPRLVMFSDDRATARELARMLEHHGYQVDVAVAASQARAMLQRPGVSGLAIDLALADDAAPAFLREVRSQPSYRHLPVLLLGMQGERGVRGGAIGVVDWLSKPLDPGHVADAVRSCLRSGSRSRPDVLHVEDDPDVRELLARLLAAESLQLHQAATLAEARTELARRRHDLVILDLMLPDGDGTELLPELSAARAPVPAIIFSAQDMDLPENDVVLRRLVKSRNDAAELAALITENLRHWPGAGPRHEDAG